MGHIIWGTSLRIIFVVEHRAKLAKRNCKVVIAFRTSKSSPKAVSDLCSKVKVILNSKIRKFGVRNTYYFLRLVNKESTRSTGPGIYMYSYRLKVTMKIFLPWILIFQTLNRFGQPPKNLTTITSLALIFW